MTVAVLVALAAPARAQTRWPLDLPPILTSSFAEFRTGRLHAGMDLGTRGQVGIACRATGDGSVVRMRMSPFGYGKALYIQMDGGPLVVYAHLSAFAAPMAARARAEQVKRRRYTFDIELPPGEIRVQAGAVIAWSGQTGVGVPHLHFELRHGDVAINPQTNGFAAPDTMAPVISEIAVTPMDAASHVDGGLDTRAIFVVGRPAATPVVGGRIGFSVRTWDHATSREYRQAPYRCELRVDGKPLYRLVQERFDYETNQLLVLEYDPERLLTKDERVQLLYLRPGNRIAGREVPQGGDGLLVSMAANAANASGRFASGPHDVEVEVADAAGHTTVRRARVIVGHVPRIEAFEAQHEDGSARWECRIHDADLFFAAAPPVARLALSRDGGAHWDSLTADTGSRVGDAGWEWHGTAPWDGGAAILLRARVRDADGLETVASWSSAAADSGLDGIKLTVRPVWRWRYAELEIQSNRALDSNLPRVAWGNGETLLQRAAPRSYRVALPLIAIDLPLELRRGSEAAPARLPLVVGGAYVASRRAARLDGLDPDLVLDVPSGALLEDVALATRRVAAAKLDLGPELRVAGPCIAVEPYTAALDQPLRVSLRPGIPSGVAPERAGIFWVNRSGDLRFLAAERDARGWLSAETRNLSTFAALADTTPPHIGSLQVTPRGTRPQRLRFTVWDRGAGLGADGVDATLDGAFAVAEWDPESNVVIVDPPARLGRGPHQLQVVVTDQLGNQRARALKFTVQ